MAARVEGTHDTLCISFGNGTAGIHQGVYVDFLSLDRECIFRSFRSSYSACCYIEYRINIFGKHFDRNSFK
jgi:hypothetical protein